MNAHLQGAKRADAYWVIDYFQKTQSFMKNGGQQNCLDKALNHLLQSAIKKVIRMMGFMKNKEFANLGNFSNKNNAYWRP